MLAAAVFYHGIYSDASKFCRGRPCITASRQWALRDLFVCCHIHAPCVCGIKDMSLARPQQHSFSSQMRLEIKDEYYCITATRSPGSRFADVRVEAYGDPYVEDNVSMVDLQSKVAEYMTEYAMLVNRTATARLFGARLRALRKRVLRRLRNHEESDADQSSLTRSTYTKRRNHIYSELTSLAMRPLWQDFIRNQS